MYTQDMINRVPLKQYNLIVTGTGWTTTQAVGIPYQIQDGSWRLKFHVRGTRPSSTDYTATIAGVIFSYSHDQSISAHVQSAATYIILASTRTGQGGLRVITNSVNIDFVTSGDVQLDRKPDWME